MPSRAVERLDPDPRREGSVRLVVGGRTVLSVPLEAIRAEKVAPGVEVTDELFARLSDWADQDAAYHTALRFLARRPFARRDLARRLALKGHSARHLTAALDRAAAAGALDDERFARHYVETRIARGRGPARIRRELAVQGVAPALVDRVLAEATEGSEQSQVVLALAEKRARQLARLPRPDRVRRVLAFLARRGYTGPEVRKLVRGAV